MTRARGLAALTCLSLSFAPAAAAQLGPCPEVNSVRDMKVVLDSVYFNPPGGSAKNVIPMQRLTANLQSQLSALRTDLGGAVTEVVVCATRKPTGASSFNREQTDLFNASRVVLEVWGTVAPSSTASSKPRATVGFVVVPLRFYEFFQNTNAASRMDGVYSENYTVRTSALENLLEQSTDFKAYVTVGIGLKLLRERAYDGAKKSFCRAQYFMQPNANKAVDSNQVQLLDYARKMTAQTVQTALGATDYHGPLKGIDPKIAAGCGL